MGECWSRDITRWADSLSNAVAISSWPRKARTTRPGLSPTTGTPSSPRSRSAAGARSAVPLRHRNGFLPGEVHPASRFPPRCRVGGPACAITFWPVTTTGRWPPTAASTTTPWTRSNACAPRAGGSSWSPAARLDDLHRSSRGSTFRPRRRRERRRCSTAPRAGERSRSREPPPAALVERLRDRGVGAALASAGSSSPPGEPHQDDRARAPSATWAWSSRSSSTRAR